MIIPGNMLPVTNELELFYRAKGLAGVMSIDPRIKFLRQYGATPMAYSTLQPGLDYFFTYEGYIAFAQKEDHVFALGDPLSSEEDYAKVIVAFSEFARNARLSIAAVQIGRQAARAYQEQGKTVNQIGIETELDISTFTLSGGEKYQVRHWYNMAKKQGVRVHEIDGNQEAAKDFKHVSDRWLQKKGEKELSFLTRPLVEGKELDVRRFYATMDDQVMGITYFNPLYQDGQIIGYYHDIVRILPEAPHGTSDLIVVDAITKFKEEGKTGCSFGLSPFYRIDHEIESYSPKIRSFIEFMFENGEKIYPAQGNAFHKDKYRGRKKPTYVAVESDKIQTINGVLDEITRIFNLIGLDAYSLEMSFFGI